MEVNTDLQQHQTKKKHFDESYVLCKCGSVKPREYNALPPSLGVNKSKTTSTNLLAEWPLVFFSLNETALLSM